MMLVPEQSMGKRSGGDDFLFHAFSFPRQDATSTAIIFIFEIVELKVVIASFESDVSILGLHIVEPAIVHDGFAVEQEPRAVVGLEKESIITIFWDFDFASPTDSKVVVEFCAWKGRSGAAEIDVLVHTFENRLLAFEFGEILNVATEVEVFAEQAWFGIGGQEHFAIQ